MLVVNIKFKRNLYRIIILILIIIALVKTSMLPSINMTVMSNSDKYTNTKIVESYSEGGRKTIYLKTANDESTRAKGLMFVRKMKYNEGMLFEYEQDDHHSMWMKNTYVSLDIIYLDTEYNIVDIIENTEPHSLKGLPSKKKCRYAIELNATSAKKFNFKINDNIKKNIKIIDNLTTLQ